MYKVKLLSLFFFVSFIFAGCSSMSAIEKEDKRDELDAMAEAAITSLIEQDPKIKQEIENSPGYAVINMKLTKVPIVGGGGGVLIFNSQEVADSWMTGNWEYQAGAEASSGEASSGGSSGSADFEMHVLIEGGASATATARVIRVQINTDLTRSN